MKGTETITPMGSYRAVRGHRGVPLVKGTETLVGGRNDIPLQSHRGVPLVKGTETGKEGLFHAAVPATEASPS